MRIISILFFLQISFGLSGQIKGDYIWLLGQDNSISSADLGYRFDFNTIPFAPEAYNVGHAFDSNNASICDEDGNLLFWSNGCAVINASSEVMPNGDSINHNFWFELLWGGECSFGYPGTQDIMILPDPGNVDGHYLLHKLNVFYQNEKDSIGFQYSYIDMSLDNGRGDVTKKNISLHDRENFMYSYLTAINHSNGVDWWVIQPFVEDSSFFVLKIDETGIHRQPDQNTHQYFNKYRSSASGTAKFSPDGTKYAIYNYYDNLHVYDFDRTTGLLSNHQEIVIEESPDSSLIIFGSVEWSPNSRFIYTTATYTLHQIDTWEADINTNGVRLIGEYDGTLDPFPTIFYLMAQGPDCKIYMCPTSSTTAYHVINRPDELGLACDFVQNGLDLPRTSTVACFPNFPRFRVDEEEKCDPSIVTLLGEPVWYRRELSVYPNPSSGRSYVTLPEGVEGVLEIRDITGRLVESRNPMLWERELTIDLAKSGTYEVLFYPTMNEDRIIYEGKLVVTK